jgi:hypothetical protein
MTVGIPWARDRRFNQALLASLAIHLVAAMMIPAVVVLSGAGPDIETISFVHVVRMQIQTPHPQARAPQAIAPVASRAAHVTQAKTAASSQHVMSPRSKAQGETSRAPVLAAVSRQGVASAEPGVSPSPMVTVAAQVNVASAAPRERPGGYMPFGAEQPVPVLDPGVRSALGALQVHVTLLITVDDNGRTKDVSFDPPLDSATEARIRAMLANASWDPATCGAGVPCEAQTKITL